MLRRGEAITLVYEEVGDEESMFGGCLKVAVLVDGRKLGSMFSLKSSR